MRKLLLSTALVLGLCAPAFAQIAPSAITGNECWNAGQGPGGPSNFFCSNMARNGSALALFSGSGAFTTAMTNLQSVLFWVGTAPTTWTITTPPNPFDGEIIQLSTDTTLTTLVTITPNTGQTMHAAFSAQTITAAAGAEFMYNLATAAWFRIR